MRDQCRVVLLSGPEDDLDLGKPLMKFRRNHPPKAVFCAMV